ncbi:hypothetical protein FACS1894120_4950 [Clostridia bacterium]|nr:hypothetical protein FACS1894120_4950 [Clostridia bacterium]
MNITTSQEHYNAGAAEIADSQEKFVEFLRFSGRLFKNDTADLIQIFAQNPNAEMIASADVWSKYGNPIKPNESSFTAINGNAVREFYDWSQKVYNIKEGCHTLLILLIVTRFATQSGGRYI